MIWKKENLGNLSVADYLVDGLLVFDESNKLILVNPQAESFFEAGEEELLGKSILDLNRLSNFRSLASLLGGGIKEVFRKELQISENFILEVTTVLIMRGHTKAGTLVVLHDISREKLAQKMKTEFVTLAAHQLRTPISAVKWSLEMILEGDLGGGLNEEQKKILIKAQEANNRSIRLINDLLSVAEIEEGRYLSELSLSSIEDLILFAAREYKEKMEKKKIKFSFQRSEEKLPKIMLDKEKIKIAVKNIIDNAVRYTPRGGKISVAVKKNRKRIEVQIKDTGLGIPRDQQDKVFTKFFRASNITKIDTEGTGLGLYISKNIIEAHGGIIWFDSKEGKGTNFYFILPLKEKFGEYLTEEFY